MEHAMRARQAYFPTVDAVVRNALCHRPTERPSKNNVEGNAGLSHLGQFNPTILINSQVA
jgi:hypothetical protein